MGIFLDRWRALLWIGATYFYFLVYAQFGFLHRLSAELGQAYWNPVLGGMALSGMAAALLTGWRFREATAMRTLAGAWAGCALSALLGLLAESWVSFMAASMATGASLAVLTVALVGVLRITLPRRGSALLCGAGTGLAYLSANLPIVFNASPAWQCGLAALVCLPALLAVRGAKGESPSAADSLQAAGRQRTVLVSTIIVFLVLIWADSAAFTQIQESPFLKHLSWGGSSQLWAIGLSHLLGALAGGLLMEGGKDRLVYLLSFPGLFVGWWMLTHGLGGIGGSLVYAGAVSLYSTALVSFALVLRSDWTPAYRAGWVYAVAGWLGSALGIGMAHDLGAVPAGFWMLAAFVLVLALLAKGKEELI